MLLAILLLGLPLRLELRFRNYKFLVLTFILWKHRQLYYAGVWLRGQDLNLMRPSGNGPDELPICSTPQYN